MAYHFTDDLVKKVERFKEIMDRGYICNSQQVTDSYNQIFNKREPNTNCSACIRRRIREMYSALEKFRQDMETTHLQQNDSISEKTESTDDVSKDKPKKRIKQKK